MALAGVVLGTEGLETFEDVSARSGVSFQHRSGGGAKDFLVETVGSGVALFDYNNDGLIDIYLVNGAQLIGNRVRPIAGGGARLYKNVGGMRFADVTAESHVANSGWGMGVAAADYDNDGWADLYVTNYGQNVLFHNNGNGTFTDVTARAGVVAGNWSTGASWGDYDGDGLLDLYVARYVAFDPAVTPRRGADRTCQYHGALVACGPRGLPGLPDILYRNNGDGSFADVTAKAGIEDPGYYGFTVLWLDYNRDGRPDIFVANDATPNFLWRNNGNGTFTEVGAETGLAYNSHGAEQSCMGAAAGDYDQDGLIDIFVTNFSEDDNTLYRNDGDGAFSDVTRQTGLAGKSWLELGWGAGILDFDNDGGSEIFVANGHIYPEVQKYRMDFTYRQSLQLFRWNHRGKFEEITGKSGKDFVTPRSARGVSFADLDNDGCVDVVINNLDAAATVLQNHCPATNRWIAITLEGTRSNRDAVGALVTVTGGGQTHTAELIPANGYMGTSDKRMWFGLGTQAKITRVDVTWPSGQKQRIENVKSNQILAVREPRGANDAR